jgi:hypothetical protein
LRQRDLRNGRERGNACDQMQELSSVGTFHEVPLDAFGDEVSFDLTPVF